MFCKFRVDPKRSLRRLSKCSLQEERDCGVDLQLWL